MDITEEQLSEILNKHHEMLNNGNHKQAVSLIRQDILKIANEGN